MIDCLTGLVEKRIADGFVISVQRENSFYLYHQHERSNRLQSSLPSYLFSSSSVCFHLVHTRDHRCDLIGIFCDCNFHCAECTRQLAATKENAPHPCCIAGVLRRAGLVWIGWMDGGSQDRDTSKIAGSKSSTIP